MGHSRVHEDEWRDDLDTYTPADISALYAGSDGVDPRAYFDQVKELGFDGVRTFGGRLTPSSARSGQRPEDMPGRIGAIADELGARGLELMVPLLTDTALAYDFHRHVHDMGVVAKSKAAIRLLEIVNEAGHGTQRGWSILALKEFDTQLLELGWAGAVTCGAALAHDEVMPVKNPTTGEIYWSEAFIEGVEQREGLIYPPAEIGNVIDTHWNRGRWPFYANVAHGANELRIAANQYRLAALSGEPGRVDHPDVQGQHVAYAYLQGVQATGMMNRSVLHGSQMRDANTKLTGVELEAAQAFIRGHRILPRGKYEFQNANNTGSWPHSPIKSAAFVEGPATNNDKTVWRAWSFRHVASGKWFLVLSGPSVDRPGLEFQHGFHLGAKLDGVGNVVHVFEQMQ